MFSRRRLKQVLNAVRRRFDSHRPDVDISTTTTRSTTVSSQETEAPTSDGVDDVEYAENLDMFDAQGEVIVRPSSKEHREALLQRAQNLAACSSRDAPGELPLSFAPSSALPPFQHASLRAGHIRLLKLKKETSGVYAQLEDFPLQDQPPYTCLSYVWGSTSQYTDIPCNNRSLKVTPHLREGLLCVHASRMASDPAWLWIDAVCINQSDDVEKAAQVTGMHEIFANASLVLAWLGPGITDVTEAFAFMPRSITSLWNHYDCGTYNSQMEGENWEAVGDPKSSQWGSLFDVFGLEYWFRLWIVQEVVGRRIGSPFDILCGQDRTSGDIILEIAYLLLTMTMADSVATNTGHLLCYDLYGYRHSTETLSRHGTLDLGFAPSSLLNIAPSRLVSEPLDKIYAVLSLLAPVTRAEIQVDYSDSNRKSFRQVAIQFSRLVLREEGTKRLERLYPTDNADILPSWCFDLWSPERRIAFPPCTDWRAGQGSDATSLREEDDVQNGIQDNVIRLRGFLVDNLQGLQSMHWENALNPGSISTPSPGHFLRSVEACKALVARVSTASEEDFARVLVANSVLRQGYRFSFDDGEGLISRLEQVSSFIRKQEEDGDSRIRSAGMPTAERQYYESMIKNWVERSLLVTNSGRLGLCPMEARTGDEVVIFKGDVMPQVIRAQGDGTYKIIRGGCYIHGLMRGELFDMPSFKERGWNDLQIS